jgi:hypothetical protein
LQRYTVVGGAFKGQFGAIIETAKCFAPYALFSFGRVWHFSLRLFCNHVMMTATL